MSIRLIATGPDGTEFHAGDTILDFRGDPAIFVEATRAASPGKSGKVLVDQNGSRCEFYDKVFALTVTADPS